MVVAVGGDLFPPPADLPLDSMVLTVSVATSLAPMKNVVLVGVHTGLEDGLLVSTLLKEVIPIEVHTGLVDGLLGTTFKEVTADGQETVMFPNRFGDSIHYSKESVIRGVDPNFVPVCIQTREGTTIELPDKVMDHILLNMSTNLVGIFFSLRPTVEMVKKWASNKWRLEGSVSISAMPGALFLSKFTTEEDVVMVLFGCWTYGKCNLSLCRWKVGFDLAANLHKFALVWVPLPRLPFEYWDKSIFRWIGNTFSNFVCVDEITRTKSRLVYVCFCIQVTAGHIISDYKAKDPMPLKLKDPMVSEQSVIPTGPKPLKPIDTMVCNEPSIMTYPMMDCENYPFTKSINELLYSPAKVTNGDPNSLMDLVSGLTS
ncbi:hypothetical protein SUGI_0920990 [Cryptomeria japonica]|nr:hypothetical protein SUGI_0920990 [Cryptomeria japonica]